jgi:rod shape-determining protein MreD
MFASLVQGPLLRLLLAGVILLAFQRTLFEDLRPAGVTLQVLLALSAAAGAVAGPQKGALAGFVLGLLYDLNVGSPLGSSSIAMGIGGYVAGYATTITVRPMWWLAAIFTGIGAAVGEAVVPVIREFIGESHPFEPHYGLVVAVVGIGAAVMSIVLVPVGRWCMRVKEPEWKAPREEIV